MSLVYVYIYICVSLVGEPAISIRRRVSTCRISAGHKVLHHANFDSLRAATGIRGGHGISAATLEMQNHVAGAPDMHQVSGFSVQVLTSL